MKFIIFLGLFFILNSTSYSQNKCHQNLVNDSSILFNPAQKEAVQLMEVKIKNNYQIQFIKKDSKNYLKIIVKDNLGYGQTGSLLLYSNKKQYFLKSITLQIIDKKSGYFILEVNPNYLTTIKENGLTSIIFQEKVEFTIPKQDSELVKQLATCFEKSL